ncbi:MAG: flagellin [Verrucomicrobiota bacterium]
MIISSNLAAQSAANDLTKTSAALTKSLAKLSSGSRIVNAYDDAAGVAISLRFDAKIERANAARDNVANAMSFTNTQDGYLKRISKTLNRMSELAMLSLDGTKSDADRALYQNEYTQLSNYITNVGGKEFNGVNLFSSATVSSVIDSEGTTFDMSGVSLGSVTYTNVTSSSIASTSSATTALGQIRTAITQLAADRATIGAFQSRLNMANDGLAATIENFTAASSVIKDVDVARESTEFSRQNILNQSTTAMLAQANQLPQSVLRLLPQ